MLVPKTHDSAEEFITAAEEKVGRRLTDDEREIVTTDYYPHGDTVPCDDADLSTLLNKIRQTSRPKTYKTSPSLQAKLLDESPRYSLDESLEKVTQEYGYLFGLGRSRTALQMVETFAQVWLRLTDEGLEKLPIKQQQGESFMLFGFLGAWPGFVSEIATISQVHDIPAWKVADLLFGAPEKWTMDAKQNVIKLLVSIPALGRATGWQKIEKKALTKSGQVNSFLRWAYDWRPGNRPPAIGWPLAHESYNDAMAANDLDHLKIPSTSAFSRMTYRLSKD